MGEWKSLLSLLLAGVVIGAGGVFGLTRGEHSDYERLKENHREAGVALAAAEGRATEIEEAAGRAIRLGDAIESTVEELDSGGLDDLDSIDRAIWLADQLELALRREGFLD